MSLRYQNPFTKKVLTLRGPCLQDYDGNQKIYFVEQPSKHILQFLIFVKPMTKLPFMHNHRGFDEILEVLEGTCTVVKTFFRKDVYEAGRTAFLPRGVSHHPCNFSKRRLVMLATATPHSDIWQDMETLYGLAKEGVDSKNGNVSFGQMVVLNKNNPTTFLPYIPSIIQRIAVYILAPIYHKRGIKPHYERFKIVK